MATPSSIAIANDAKRVTEAAMDKSNLFADVFSSRNLPTWVLTVTIMGIVTAVERVLDAVDTGIALEWIILTVVALLTFALSARVLVRATRAAQAWFDDYAAHAVRTRADVKSLEVARRDPPLASEMVAAQARADAILKNYRLRAGSL